MPQLSSLIDKFLRRVGLTTSEKQALCQDLGAAALNEEGVLPVAGVTIRELPYSEDMWADTPLEKEIVYLRDQRALVVGRKTDDVLDNVSELEMTGIVEFHIHNDMVSHLGGLEPLTILQRCRAREVIMYLDSDFSTGNEEGPPSPMFTHVPVPDGMKLTVVCTATQQLPVKFIPEDGDIRSVAGAVLGDTYYPTVGTIGVAHFLPSFGNRGLIAVATVNATYE